jgi:rod shape-determining protein MreC
MFFSNSNSRIRTFPGNIFGTILIPFQNSFSIVDKKIRNSVLYFDEVEMIRQENKKLKSRIDELEKDNRDLIEYKQKIFEFKQALNIKDRYSQYDILGANIIAKDPGNWFDVFTLDVGSNDGVEENTTVLTGSGLVGKVVQVNVFSSRVISILDPDNTVSARISKTRELVRIKGDMELKGYGICKMDYIPNDVDILTGDLVETSGMGGIYPKGILIGTVKNISISPNEFTKQAEVQPVVDFKRLEEVYLLIRKK